MNELQSEFCRHKNPVICTLFSYLPKICGNFIVILWVMSLKSVLVSFFATNGESGGFSGRLILAFLAVATQVGTHGTTPVRAACRRHKT